MTQIVRIFAYIRPHRLQEVKSALALLPISGLTVTDARGSGNHPEKSVNFLGQDRIVPLPIRTMIEVVVAKPLQDDVIDAITRAAHTGEPGDGKIFVENIENAIRIRTGEQNDEAV
ncbi:transcriptional regulator [bacterium]|jgi:nitrogen regulatory protein P-II 1|nr:transcriptional regulator [bacterium]